MPFRCCNGEPTIRQPPPETMAAPPGAALCSNAMARAPAARASMPAAIPAPPAPTMATSVSNRLASVIGVNTPFRDVARIERQRNPGWRSLARRISHRAQQARNGLIRATSMR
jgi:hypothetical protein